MTGGASSTIDTVGLAGVPSRALAGSRSVMLKLSFGSSVGSLSNVAVSV
jgi:hypothetical protein